MYELKKLKLILNLSRILFFVNKQALEKRFYLGSFIDKKKKERERKEEGMEENNEHV